MTALETKKTWYQRAIQRFAASRPGSWLLLRTVPSMDKWMMRRTGGKKSFTSAMSGLPVVMLTSIGAKSGQERKAPLVIIPRGEGYVLIASNFGQPRNPAWYYNLVTNPRAWLDDGHGARAFRVREAEGEERDQLFQRAVDLYAGYAAYARRTERVIPVLVLEPEPEPDEPNGQPGEPK